MFLLVIRVFIRVTCVTIILQRGCTSQDMFVLSKWYFLFWSSHQPCVCNNTNIQVTICEIPSTPTPLLWYNLASPITISSTCPDHSNSPLPTDPCHLPNPTSNSPSPQTLTPFTPTNNYFFPQCHTYKTSFIFSTFTNTTTFSWTGQCYLCTLSWSSPSNFSFTEK